MKEFTYFFQEKQGLDSGLPPEGAASSAVGTWDVGVQVQRAMPDTLPSVAGRARGVGKKGDKGVKSIGGVSALHKGTLQPERELREEGWNGQQ